MHPWRRPCRNRESARANPSRPPGFSALPSKLFLRNPVDSNDHATHRKLNRRNHLECRQAPATAYTFYRKMNPQAEAEPIKRETWALDKKRMGTQVPEQPTGRGREIQYPLAHPTAPAWRPCRFRSDPLPGTQTTDQPRVLELSESGSRFTPLTSFVSPLFRTHYRATLNV